MAMEPPVTFGADAVRDEKVKALRAIPPLIASEIAAGHRARAIRPGLVDGKRVPGYRQEDGVQPELDDRDLRRAQARIDNWRWAGVPFYLRTGKRLTKRVTEIAIQFKRPPYLLFHGTGIDRWSRTCSRCAFSRTRASRCASTRRCRAGDATAIREHGFPLRQLLRQGAAGGVRAAAARLHAGRRDALHAHRRDAAGLEAGGYHHEGVERKQRSHGEL